MNDLDDPKFDVTQKSIRDHYNLLEKQKKRLRDEEKASGTSPVHSDFEDAMENIIQLFTGKDEEDQKNHSEKNEKYDADAAKILEMRQSVME